MLPSPFPLIPAGSRPIIGLDIGGTKCAVSRLEDGRVCEKLRVPTHSYAETFPRLLACLEALSDGVPPSLGVSCGGPIDTSRGIIGTPPNLPGDWHGQPIVSALAQRLNGHVTLMNDANACALAEWSFGAGTGCQHMVFLTSGTGMGAGLILNGQLYAGSTGDAGEIGHVRLRPDGPEGYGKRGSVEGFTSGGGIARLAQAMIARSGRTAPAWFSNTPEPLTTKRIAEGAFQGDPSALAVFHEAGTYLGEVLALLIDVLNPERIVLGGFFPRCRPLLEPAMQAALTREALPELLAHCRILPSSLGETIGSHGAIAAALHELNSSPIASPTNS